MDKVSKEIKKIPPKDAEKIADVLEKIIANDVKNLDLKRLKGYPGIFRVRVGKYRIIYEKQNANVIILNISKKNDNTYGKLK